MIRCIRYSRFGLAENPVGQIVTWKVKDRIYLADVVGVCRRNPDLAIMLQTRHFNGQEGPEVCAGSVKLVLPDEADYEVAG